MVRTYSQLRGFKYVTTFFSVFKKIGSKDKKMCNNFYSISKAETITSESDIDNVFQSIYTTIIADIQKSSLKDSG